MILRRATQTDIPYLATRWYQEKPKTCFGGAKVEWSIPLCAASLNEAIVRPDHYLLIGVHNAQTVAACAACLIRTIIPPHPLVVTEYMWWGDDRKSAAKVWQGCIDWGKLNGATYANYVLNAKQSNPKKFTELHQWRAL